MSKSGLSCSVHYPPPGSTEPGSFNGEVCTLRGTASELLGVLHRHSIKTKCTHYMEGHILIKFRVARDLFGVVREALVLPYEPPPPEGCTKIVYSSQDAALRGVAKTIQSPWYSNLSGDPLVPYQCESCGGWHIGHRYRQTVRRFDVKVGLPF